LRSRFAAGHIIDIFSVRGVLKNKHSTVFNSKEEEKLDLYFYLSS
jgi:hypothetical protein